MKLKSLGYKLGCIIGVIALFFSCDERVTERMTKKSIILSNGMHLTVEKTNTETTSIGILTKHNYGTKHTFKYKLKLSENSINWDF